MIFFRSLSKQIERKKTAEKNGNKKKNDSHKKQQRNWLCASVVPISKCEFGL